MKGGWSYDYEMLYDVFCLVVVSFERIFATDNARVRIVSVSKFLTVSFLVTIW